jgi:hypothetical protein
MENTENIYKDLSETEINIIDDIFSHGMIISQTDIHDFDIKRIQKQYMEKLPDDQVYDQLINLLKNNTYNIKLPNIYDRKQNTIYFAKRDIIKEFYDELNKTIKKFFNNDISKYAEYIMLERYKEDFERSKWHRYC